ncbi:Alpha/Beta hydrolase protein [Catenaria anguillulae PL171]|uniref:triacylglycerol lipase n=1 Tax=Catenaria anguillulae PL171 TaxID=765915 RepID=A0A1Y2I4C2_9FUNG|nr:Alpha/Beta hydrolase protein [Catenaria anguillulae PL171]
MHLLNTRSNTLRRHMPHDMLPEPMTSTTFAIRPPRRHAPTPRSLATRPWLAVLLLTLAAFSAVALARAQSSASRHPRSRAHASPLPQLHANLRLKHSTSRLAHSSRLHGSRNRPGGVYAMSLGPSILSTQVSFALKSRPFQPVQPQSLFEQQQQQPGNDFDAFSSQQPVAGSFNVPWAMEPNVSDKSTVLSLAKMTANAYTLPINSDWEPLEHFFTNESFGWSDTGLRGYVYTTPDEDLAVVAIKGTSASFLGIGSDTAPKDKVNDNRMFSCCCAHVDRTWFPVCDCFRGNGQCSWDCLRNATDYEASYFTAGQDLYKAISLLYPRASLWFTGHSLGGGVSALLATHFQVPAVTFEAPGERLFAERLGLTLPGQDTSTLPIYHFGHNADPIFIGRCRGPRSSCYFAGYAIETKCHVGNVCVYPVRETVDEEEEEEEDGGDGHEGQANVQWWPGWGSGNTTATVTTTKPADPEPTSQPPDESPAPPTLRWGVDIRHHRIHEVIDNVISAWPGVPECKPQPRCRDCSGWKFV